MLSTWLGAIGVPPADAITGSGRNRGECLGGVGVSGIDHDDEPVAQAGAETFGK